jgi:hypothetical protein
MSFYSETLYGSDKFVGAGVDGMIILKWVFKKYVVMV